MEAIGKNTARSEDLKRRATEIFEKERTLKKTKQTAKELADDIKVLYSAANSYGYNADVLRDVLKEMHMEPDARAEHYQLEMLFSDERDIYRHALGLIDDDGRPAANDDGKTTISVDVPISLAIIKERHKRETAEADA